MSLDLFYQPRYNPLLPVYSDVLLFHAISCGHAEERLKAVGRKRDLKEALFVHGKDDLTISSSLCEIRESSFVMKNGASSMNFLSTPTCFFLPEEKNHVIVIVINDEFFATT